MRLLIVFSYVLRIASAVFTKTSPLRLASDALSTDSETSAQEEQTAAMIVLLAWMLVGLALGVVACLLGELHVKPCVVEEISDPQPTDSWRGKAVADKWCDESQTDEAVSTDESCAAVDSVNRRISTLLSPGFFKTPPPGWRATASFSGPYLI